MKCYRNAINVFEILPVGIYLYIIVFEYIINTFNPFNVPHYNYFLGWRFYSIQTNVFLHFEGLLTHFVFATNKTLLLPTILRNLKGYKENPNVLSDTREKLLISSITPYH